MADFYELLGVSRTADADELKRAYRKKARELHPDANPDDPAAAERFKEVARAYEVLSDADQRARYDRFGEAGVSSAASSGADPFGFGGAGFGGGLGDIFDAFFGGGSGGGFGGGRQSGPAGPPRGQDQEVTVQLPFRDAVFGTESPVEIRTYVSCVTCTGKGTAPNTEPVTCSECGGAGQVRRVRQSVLGQMMTTSACPRCGGWGTVIVTPCPTCSGEGRTIEQRTFRVDVPAGVDDGSTLRLGGRGAAGPRGGTNGDLYVHLRVRPDERFERRGNDLVARVPIGFAQAALGAHLPFETLDGAEDLVIEPGTPTGRVYRLRGRGVPVLQGRGRGDLLVEVTVEVPAKLSKDEEELLRRYAELRGEEIAPPDRSLLGRIKSAFS
jgi:molecular chaperone DnaJ